MAEPEHSLSLSSQSDGHASGDAYPGYQRDDDLQTSSGVYDVLADSSSFGYFGKVFKCRHRSNKTIVALKIFKKRHEKTGLHEIDILQTLMKKNITNYNCVKMLDSFYLEGHVCIAFEHLGLSLRQYLVQKGYFTIRAVKQIAHDCFIALRKLKQLDVVHADIKPDNIVLVDPRPAKDQTGPFHVKLIDFGAAHACKNQSNNPYIQTCWYRSPEVIVKLLPYNYMIDVWSLGCTLGELLAGKPLFPGRNEYEQLMYITELRGGPPAAMVKKCKAGSQFYERVRDSSNPQIIKYVVKSPDAYERSLHFRRSKLTLKDIHKSHRTMDPIDVFEVCRSNQDLTLDDKAFNAEFAGRQRFGDFLDHILEPNPEERLDIEECLNDDFIKIDF